MYPIVKEVSRLTLPYVRKGGHKNRKIQRSRMLIFAQFCGAKMGAKSLAQVGQRHVNIFWKQEVENKAESTRYAYFLCLCELFELAEKPEPKRPEN